jgi:hypothetical protein
VRDIDGNWRRITYAAQLGGYCAVLRSFERHKHKQVTRDIAVRSTKEGSVHGIDNRVLHGIVHCAGKSQHCWLVWRMDEGTLKTPIP